MRGVETLGDFAPAASAIERPALRADRARESAKPDIDVLIVRADIRPRITGLAPCRGGGRSAAMFKFRFFRAICGRPLAVLGFESPSLVMKIACHLMASHTTSTSFA